MAIKFNLANFLALNLIIVRGFNVLIEVIDSFIKRWLG